MPHYHAYDKSGSLKTDVGTLTFDHLINDMNALRKTGSALGIVDAAVTDIGKSTNGRPIPALCIGNNPANRILLVGCHHAREWISVEIPFLVGKYLIDNYKDAANAVTKKEKTINHLVDNAEIWIVPMLNPDGHLKTMKPGRSMWRANTNIVSFPVDTHIDREIETKAYHTGVYNDGYDDYDFKCYKFAPAPGPKTRTERYTVAAGTYEGVDLNRNYAVPAGPPKSKSPPWGTETADTTKRANRPSGAFYELLRKTAPNKGAIAKTGWLLTTSKSPEPPDIFCGPSAGSEDEVTRIEDLLAKGNFKTVISYHNYSQLLLYPDDAAVHAGTQFLGKGMRDLFKDQKAKYKYESGSSLYATSGDSMEWAWRVHKVVNYTIELPPTDADATAKNWGFNRLPESEIQATFESNLPVALCAINCAIANFAPPAKPKGVSGMVMKAGPNCWEQFKGWKP
jgi:hypothetical protein